MRKAAFQLREVSSVDLAGARLLSCVTSSEGEGGEAQAFFKSGVDAAAFEARTGTEILGSRSIGSAAVLHLSYTGINPQLHFQNSQFSLPLTQSERELFEGLNVALAVRNGETATATLAWLRYHCARHNLQGAVILDRAPPDADQDYIADVEAGLSEIKDLKQVMVVRFDVPLGHEDQPAEAHPINAPDAPGKDRMEIPKAAPWESPLGEVQVFELLRHRWLNSARAVALLDISDLVSETTGKGTKGRTLFDMAVKSESGVVTLLGQHCYPWRVRKDQDATHGDHICVQFDATKLRRRWVIAPKKAATNVVWRLIRVVGAQTEADEWVKFYRCMALRHPTPNVGRIVPKTSLIEDRELLKLARKKFDHKPLRMPEIPAPKVDPAENDVAIITCMKNEGPFILEWLAYHRAIGVNRFLVYTNDCNDGTDSFLDLLQEKGFVQHRDNPFKGTDLKPQHAALQAGETEPVIQNADWVISMDVDEFINVKTGDGTLAALFKAVGDANLISCTWRLFGNSDVHEYSDAPLMAQFTRCALEQTRKPHQAWGFKTLYRNIGLFKKLGVHRPKGLNPQLWSHIHWVNGSGQALPKDMYRNAWRSTASTVGYDLVQLNHYAVRSAESFLVKRDRGRVNHVDRDQGMAYWFRMNNNTVEDTSIQRMIPAMQAEMDRLLSDPEIAAAHAFSVERHQEKIRELRETSNYSKFYEDLTGARQERLARLHPHFGANVFLAGPEVVPDWVVERDLPDDFFFTVEKQDTAH
ncbi:glycosyltransferase family 2 protein [Shimia sp. MMG029]|uniref:glycosyltransferase family 2 protein n=1 Tax=Shimia sp. MMG029 TaxID=3021978 RepID=UPI0022FDF23A|nr:glycosyltransferase family 2 protein [Shimia sp. MMG029]MDA5558631.1 glycosyltransferase family 2 protein [Shimia sp. MMG029]